MDDKDHTRLSGSPVGTRALKFKAFRILGMHQGHISHLTLMANDTAAEMREYCPHYR